MGNLTEDVSFSGRATFANAILNTGSVTDNTINAPLSATKLEHQFNKTYAQPNTAATSVTQVIHEVTGATCRIKRFAAGSIVAALSTATVTVDLKKNGTTCLSGVITLDNGNTAYVAEAGTLSTTTAVDGDVFTIVTVATAGGGTLPTGLYVSLILDEDYGS